jgi:hypothetical protein
MFERGGSLEWWLACATVYGFQRFRAQIEAKVEGFSPRGFLVSIALKWLFPEHTYKVFGEMSVRR